MNESDKESILQHIRGATVIHKSPFSDVEIPTADDLLSLEECEKFVVPFYRVSFQSTDTQFKDALKNIFSEITPKIVEVLLTEYNWRPRLTGAFFAALKRFDYFEDHLGRLLVRSDLCFAGNLYCVALTEFNSPNGMSYLKKYLDYYLTRPDLDYNQTEAMGAMAYLDDKNGTAIFESYRPLWDKYIAAKTWKPNLEEAVIRFENEMQAIDLLRSEAEAGTK
jgi:hypothetical protein